MADYNRVILMGRLTRDVELKYTQGGLAVTDIGLAVSDRRKSQQTGEWIEETTFVDVTLWGRTAEVASEYLSKGMTTFVEGRLKLDSWEKDGQKHSKIRVVGERLQLLPRGTGGGGPPRGNRHDDSEYSRPVSYDEEAPAGAARHEGGGESGGEDIPF